MDRQEIAEFLSTVSGFSSLAPEDLLHLADDVRISRFSAGDRIIRRGDAGDTMHVISGGRVKVVLYDAHGAEKLVVPLAARELFGEMALLTGERRSADVVAETDVSTIVVARDSLQPLLRAHPQLARFLTEILGRRLEEGGGIEWVGKYRLLGKLGEGATSKVYQGLHPQLNRVVAIKMLSHALVYDETFKERFLQEARTIAGLTHPNIVQIYDTESTYATYFIVMERVNGTDLAKKLKAERVLSPSETMNILRQVGTALAYAHAQGIVHRDIKPANCAVDDLGVVKLMDFGIASRIQKSTGERAKIVEGTPRYLAPEAAVGRAVDGRADIYSLGIMAFEMVTGRVPFYSETIRELLEMHVRKRPPDITKIRGGLPEGLISFINGALVKRPDERLTDWDQILKLLDTQPALTYEVRPEKKNQELVSLRYPDGTADAVRVAMARWMKELSAIPGVEVAHARLVPVSLADSETGRHPAAAVGPPPAAAPTPNPSATGTVNPATGEVSKRSTSAWLQKLGGLGIAGERSAKGPPTRAMPTTED